MKPESIANIRAVALECLLEDQIRSQGSDYGSWGKSTLDYCYLTTAEPRWIPGRGSITQTAWALLGLRDSLEFCDRKDRLVNAAGYADEYVSNYIGFFLQHPERDRNNEARNRHAATALLADLLVSELLPERQRRHIGGVDLFAKYSSLLTELGRYLEEHGGRRGITPTTEAALVALYPLLVRTLLNPRKSHGSSSEDGILRGLVEAWRKVDVVKSAANLLARFDAKASPVISIPHVWAAILDVTSIVAEEDDDVGSCARSLRAEVEHDAKLGLDSVAGARLPTCREGSLWDPWGTLALLVQLGPEYEERAGQVAQNILEALQSVQTTAGPTPILGGCTHLWSILARRTIPGAVVVHQTESSSHLPALGALVNAGKFSYRHWPRDETTRNARDLRAYEIYEAWVRGARPSAPAVLRRFVELYRGDIARGVALKRNERSPCRSVLLAGYTTSGKSAAAEFLELHVRLGRLVKRLTTATWDPGEPWEKRYYEVMGEAEFEECRDRMFGVHLLKGARFGFDIQSSNDVPESLFRIMPVGWSYEAISDVWEFCRDQGDEPLVVALRPSEDILEKRIRRRWGGNDVLRQLRDAKEFYRGLPSGVHVIDSSGPKEEMFCKLLALMKESLTLAEGCDAVISYARPQLDIAKEIQTTLRAMGIKSFVAATDPLPSLEARAQENIDHVFELADVLVVIWSREYPMREFASYEWTTWVKRAWGKDDNQVVFVTVDDTPLPPDVRKAHHLEWTSSDATSVADAVKHRLVKLNLSM